MTTIENTIRRLDDEDLDEAMQMVAKAGGLLAGRMADLVNAEIAKRAEIRIMRGTPAVEKHDADWYASRQTEEQWLAEIGEDDDARAKHDAAIARAEEYGVDQTNPLSYDLRAEMEAAGRLDRVDWTDPDLAQIVRFRLITDPGFPVWDVSYCLGRRRDGSLVDVGLPFSQLRKGNGGWKRSIVEYAQEAGVNAKRLGFFDAISTLA